MDEFARFRTWGRIGGLTAWARNEPETMVGPAHLGFRRRFENLVTEAAAARGETLSPADLAIRADRARRAHMLTLAAKSAAVRRKKAAPASEEPGAAQEASGGSRRRPAAA